MVEWLSVGVLQMLLSLVRLLSLLLLGSSISTWDDTACARQDPPASTCRNRDELRGLWKPVKLLLLLRLGHSRRNLSTRNRSCQGFRNDISSTNGNRLYLAQLCRELIADVGHLGGERHCIYHGCPQWLSSMSRSFGVGEGSHRRRPLINWFSSEDVARRINSSLQYIGLNHRRRVSGDPVRGHLDVLGLIRRRLRLDGPSTGHGARHDTTSKLCLNGNHGRVTLPHLLRGSIGRWLGRKLHLLRLLLWNGHSVAVGRLLVLHIRSSSVLWHLRRCRGLPMPISPDVIVAIVVIVVVVVALRSSGIGSRVLLPGLRRLSNSHPSPTSLLHIRTRLLRDEPLLILPHIRTRDDPLLILPHIRTRLLRDDPLLILPNIRASSLGIICWAFRLADFPLAMLCVVPDVLNLTWIHGAVAHRPTLRSTAPRAGGDLRSTASRAGGETQQSTGNSSLPLPASFIVGTDIPIILLTAIQRGHPQFVLDIG